MSEHPHSQHRSHSRRRRHREDHREGHRSSADASNRSQKEGASHTRSSRHHQRHSKGKKGHRLFRRLLRNPLIPLAVIVCLIAFALMKSDIEQPTDAEKMQMRPIHEGFDDAKGALQALQLMDAKRLIEAAQAIQGLEMPPIRLSTLMGNVRLDTSEARQTLRSVIYNWIFDQDSGVGGTVFPSKDTPTSVLDFIASFEQYRSSSATVATPHAKDRELATLFKRVSIEKQIRMMEQPTQAPLGSETPAPDPGYAPPVEAP